MPNNRAAAWEIESNRTHGVWEVLCRSALRGADIAAQVLGLDTSESQLERAELLIGYGVTPSSLPGARPADVERAVDWARLSEFERGRIARELKGTALR